MKFVRDTWYAAAWSEDIGRALFSRKILNEQILFFRREDGTPNAIADRCPHRFVPLSKGKLVGDQVECLYHGLMFNGEGACVANPHGVGVVPRAAKARSYPLAEKYGVVWIWMGEPVMADAERIPDFHWLDSPSRYRQVHGTINLKANYLLVMDNLTDLSHAAFVHEKTLEPRQLAKASFQVSEDAGEIWTKQFVPSMPIPPLFTFVKGFTGVMDHWLEMRCHPPGCMITFYGVTEPGNTREQGWSTFNPNLITPETDTTTHYLWATARDFDIDDQKMTASFKEGAQYAFEHEDRPIIESQQEALGGRDLMEMRPVLLQNDQGSVRARRVVDRMIRAEDARLGQQPEAPAIIVETMDGTV